jgi:molecular chaperone DnaK (HSP70)
MNETTAVALNYGILRNLPADQTPTVLFVDVGHATTQAALVSFSQVTRRRCCRTPRLGVSVSVSLSVKNPGLIPACFVR